MFVGAGAMATLVPECDIFLDECAVSGAVATLAGTVDDDFLLIPGLYKGCVAKIETNNNTTPEQYLVIKDNSSLTITFNENISQTPTGAVDVHILAYGSPVPGPILSSDKTSLLGDNWLGLVNTFNPPNVEVEVKQLNLAVSGTRNLTYQFKGNETVSGGSMDISMNNGSWLYYTLGKMTIDDNDGAGGVTTTIQSTTALANDSVNDYFLDESAETIVRGISGCLYPPIHVSNVPRYRHDDASMNADIFKWTGNPIAYTFTEVNGDILPSFSLEVVYGKDGRTATTILDTNNPNENMLSRVFTGCQVNNLTLNFEEAQEVKCSIDYVTRRAFDIPNTDIHSDFNGHIPNGGKITVGDLQNYSTDANNQPFMFSEGAIKVFGQTYARIKSGSIAIANNLQPQRFVGNYSREVTSAHLPAQRTYELSFTMLITDTKLWDELRSETEHTTGVIDFSFAKSNGDKFQLTFSNYLVNGVSIPFPEDKGPVEVELTVSARTLDAATYQGTWGIVSIGGVATQN